ncbi:hypothetical protein ACSSNL_16060 [Thalassobius sp. S69A]|uniref:hypothetical protein n=1 Tax=unclassified Thalassovita TaxID=2619711 RepID=UPI000C101E3A|nr:hypothetical protein [Paracoccaceae bacterium]MBT25583.1 hypothetical protein [Paracoccaceae bacterium]|tara:strand:- start:10 stop:465 length:456 start_codon:yes stop_codon:yes gene_type:complete
MAFEKYSLSGILAYVIPLYAAPILAGLSAAPWASVPVFALFFSALSLKTRKLPSQPALLILNALVALIVNGAIAAVLFGLGYLGGRMTQPLGLPLWGPVLICAGATAFGIWRYRWTPQSAQFEAFLDDALDQIDRMQPPEPDENRENDPLD